MNTNQRLVFEQDFSDESKFFETEDYCIESYGLFEDLTMDYDTDQEPEIVRLAKGALLNGNR
jgi:hypothetical protein